MKAATAERPSRATVSPRAAAVAAGKHRTATVITIRERRQQAAIYYLSGMTVEEIAERLGFYWLTIHKDLKQLDVPRRDRRRKHPRPAERTCARDGCSVRFTPTPNQLQRGAGRYCTKACADVAKRLHPLPAERECARPGCSVLFVPDAHKAAHGRGLYCSRPCRDADRWRFRTARVQITCEQCGRGHWVKSPYYRQQRFCSSTCWASWRKVWAIKTLKLLPGSVRQKLAGVRGHEGAEHGIDGFHHGHEGGAPPKSSGSEQQRMYEMLQTGRSYREIAAEVFGDAKYYKRVERFAHR
jgi:hypothetical protein